MHEYLVGPARHKPQIWRLIVGLLLGLAIYIALVVMIFALLGGVLGLDGEAAFSARTPFATLLLLGTFTCMTTGVWIAAKLLHGRSFGSLIGPYALAISDFWSVFKLCGLIIALSFLLPAPLGIELTSNLDLSRWVMLLPLSMALLFIQVSAEELVFRGYLQSQLAAKFKSPLVWMILPSLVFGVSHYDVESAGANAPLIALWAAFYGIMLADITARAGNLGPAIALHFLNNTAAILLVSAQGDLSGLALYTYPFEMSDTKLLRQMLPIELGMMVIMWLGARLAIRR